jgi:hypothetical protein
MALAAHDGTLPSLLMTALAIQMKRFGQPRLSSFVFQSVAVRAPAVFGSLAFDLFPILVDMMALPAIVDLGRFIVPIVLKNGRRSLGFGKHRVVHMGHIFLRKTHHNPAKEPHNGDKPVTDPSIHGVPPHDCSGFSMTA